MTNQNPKCIYVMDYETILNFDFCYERLIL